MNLYTDEELRNCIKKEMKKYYDELNSLKSQLGIKEEKLNELKAVILEQKNFINLKPEQETIKIEPAVNNHANRCSGTCKNGEKCTKRVKVGNYCNLHKKTEDEI